MKRKKLFLFLLVIIFFFSLSGCKKAEERNGASAIFYLNGGTYNNNSNRIIYYYDAVTEGKETYIKNMQTDKITRPGYVLEGWYRTMNEDGTFEDKWDFEKDKMNHQGINLYAKWIPDVSYAFELHCGDEVYMIELDNGYKNQEFSDDRFNYAKNYASANRLTLIGFSTSEEGDSVEDKIIHPCEGESLTIKVYAKFIEGNYRVVRTASELVAALSGNYNIYLAADIDMKGMELNAETYTRHFIGNHHTISNFKVSADPSKVDTSDLLGDGTRGNLFVSIFNVLLNATVEDVTFKDVQYIAEKDATRVQNVYIVPLAVKAENATIKNVQIMGTLSVTTKKPYTALTDQLCMIHTNSTISEDCSVSVTQKNND